MMIYWIQTKEVLIHMICMFHNVEKTPWKKYKNIKFIHIMINFFYMVVKVNEKFEKQDIRKV